MQSPTVATVKHGDRLEILRRRRLFLLVRTPNGAEGWTDDRQLLSSADMAALRDLRNRAGRLPTQGQAFAFRDMTLHTLPAAQSPTFVTIAANDKVDVLSHMRTPRTELRRRPLIPPTPKKPKAVKSGQSKASKYPPVPMPKPPAPPANWLDLSKTDVDEEDEEPAEEAPAPKPVLTDDWSLVRTAAGQSGWVLTRRLVMAIPDDVAQYAEGKRIVSYFPLATVMDGDQKKPTWLWTTTESGPQPYDFASFRVFVWNARRHRYETAFIARKVEGFSPVLVHDVEYGETVRKGKTVAARYPGFSICLENDDGQRVRREFALLGNIVRYAGEQACEAPGPPLAVLDTAGSPGAPAAAPPAAPAAGESFWQRFRTRLRTMTKGWFGK